MKLYKKVYNWIMDINVELRIRLLYVLIAAVLIANVVSVVTMIVMGQSFAVWCSNVVMLLLMIFSAYCAFVLKKYNLAAIFMAVSCDFLAIPVMFFTSGGYNSGMPIWMVFGAIVTCLICSGGERGIIALLTILVDICCIIIAHHKPELVTELKGENASYNDMIFSFVTVTIILTLLLLVHLKAYDLQRIALEQKQMEIARIALLDELTGVYNRRAYEKDIKELIEEKTDKIKCLVIADVNGLKKANDEIGHIAGDEIIAATAKCLSNAFEGFGNVYRIGGDEFAALLKYETNEKDTIFVKLDETISSWSGKYAKSIAIAKGVCEINEHPTLDYEGLEKIADVLMYEDKKRYYEKSGNERRRR